MLDMSEQHALNCMDTGCDGGYPDKVVEWIHKNGGIAEENASPYLVKKETCLDSQKSFTLPNANPIWKRETMASLQELVHERPSVIVVDADSFRFYSAGVMNCEKPELKANLNHAIVAVGYDMTDSKSPYFIAKNSWGSRWGEDGYLRMLASDTKYG
jgi:C1A family cysteine protease